MIKELEKQFTGTGEVKGFKFTQMLFTQHAYLYEVNSGEQIHFEVFKRLKSPVCIDFEKRIYSDTEFKETYPKANRFGVDAFTKTNVYDGIAKMHEIERVETLKKLEEEQK